MPKLGNLRHERFCHEYLIHFDAARAWKEVAGAPKGAKQTAHKVLQRPDVQIRLQELADGILDRLEITEARIAEELARVAFADVRWVVRWGENGVEFRPSEELSEVAASAIKAVKEVPLKGGGKALQIQMHDKLGALNSLAKYKKMFTDGDGPVVNNFILEIPAPLSREEWEQRYGVAEKTA